MFGSRNTAWPTEIVPCPAALATNIIVNSGPEGVMPAEPGGRISDTVTVPFCGIVPMHQRHRRSILG